MRKLIGFIFCLFIIIQGPWTFIPNDTLDSFLVRNTSLSEEVAPYIAYEMCKLSNASEDGWIFISYEAFQKMNSEYIKRMSEIEKEQPEPDKDLDKKIDNLINELEE